MKRWTIYKITHLATGLAYIGCTVNLHRRLYTHRYDKMPFVAGLYDVQEIASALSRQAAGVVEALLIKEHGTLAPYGFNNMSGGFKDATHSTASKLKMTAKQSARPLGRKFSEESRAKMRAAKLGKPSPMKGRKASDEARANMSASAKRRAHTLEGAQRLEQARQAWLVKAGVAVVDH